MDMNGFRYGRTALVLFEQVMGVRRMWCWFFRLGDFWRYGDCLRGRDGEAEWRTVV